MERIDGDWIRQRLAGKRGEQKRLAEALGISEDQMSKTLSGRRNVQPDELPRLLAYFGEQLAPAPAGFAESDIAPYAVPDDAEPAVSGLMTYALVRSFPWLGVFSGDLLRIEESAAPAANDLVLVTLTDPDTAASRTVVRRWLPPWLTTSAPDDTPIEVTGDNVYVIFKGVVRGLTRNLCGNSAA